jgi:hypothetical protein
MQRQAGDSKVFMEERKASSLAHPGWTLAAADAYITKLDKLLS